MVEKIIKVSLNNDGNILIYNNNVLKKEIKNDCNELSGQDIFDVLDVNYDDYFKISAIQDDDGNKRYKVYKMIYELFENIINKLLTSQEDYEFDVDISEKNNYDEIEESVE